MYLKNILLKNFRNYENLELDLSEKYNIFFGENGAGKTNILESISVISSGKSFRSSSDEEMVMNEKDYYFCRGSVFDEKMFVMEVGYKREGGGKRKKLKVDGKEINKFSDYFGILLTSVISPDDIYIVKGPSEIKRKYFDIYLAKVEKSYTELLLNFRKALVNRNLVLKKIKNGNMSEKKHLEVWNDIFAELSSKIVVLRKNFISKLNSYFFDIYSNISGMEFCPKIVYRNSFHFEGKKEILKELENNYTKEIVVGITLQGPQRDNYLFVDDKERDCIPYFSQGQKRVIAIALKCSELYYIENSHGKKPVVLVDDIFAELDKKRKDYVFDYFTNDYQVLFTAVNLNAILSEGFNCLNVYHVEKGNVVKI